MVERGRGRGREGGCAAGHRGDSLSLLGVVCTHKLCLLWPQAERHRAGVATTLRLFLPHAVIYQEEPEEARGGGGLGGFCVTWCSEGHFRDAPTQICGYVMESWRRAGTSGAAGADKDDGSAS